jgi:hypothetical protein
MKKYVNQKITIPSFEALNKFIDQGVKTNIHYVLSKNSIAEAIDRLKIDRKTLDPCEGGRFSCYIGK